MTSWLEYMICALLSSNKVSPLTRNKTPRLRREVNNIEYKRKQKSSCCLRGSTICISLYSMLYLLCLSVNTVHIAPRAECTTAGLPSSAFSIRGVLDCRYSESQPIGRGISETAEFPEDVFPGCWVSNPDSFSSYYNRLGYLPCHCI